MKKLLILLACVSVLFSCGDKDNNGTSEPLYKEPILTFGASKSTIKSQEKMTLLYENEEGLLYAGPTYQLEYAFENDKLIGSGVLLPLKTDSKQLRSFLSSKYSYLGENEGNLFWQSKDGEIVVGVNTDKNGVIVAYASRDYVESLKSNVLDNVEKINHVINTMKERRK